MRPTLFFIPEKLYGIDVFGFGWLLAAWLCFSAIMLAVQWRRDGWNAELRGYLLTVGIVALVIVGLMPWLVDRLGNNGTGLPIRGYGVMLLLAIVSGVSLAIYRARQVGVHPDLIVNLAFCMIVFGLIGARLFFIIQYWDVLKGRNVAETIGNLFNFVEGGLVVYGSLIGALAAAIWFMRRHKLPVLAMADLIAPSMALGLAVGRMGCLMNGCCYGGVCESPLPWAVSFPNESPVYAHQKSLGQLHGFRLDQDEQGRTIVRSVVADSPADTAGLVEGDPVLQINGEVVRSLDQARELVGASGAQLTLETESGGPFEWIASFPDRSLPVHPTQIYSAINAALICLVLLAVFPYRRRDGEVLALTLTIYPITRFLLELIRNDEPDKFGTGLTISQIVSLAILAFAACFWVYLSRRPPGSVWRQPAKAESSQGSRRSEVEPIATP